MALKASGKSDEELLQAMEETVLAYDNMCHLDSLYTSRRDLPLPAPFNKMWQKVGKVIDHLHLQNNKDPLCNVKYNPDNSLSKSVCLGKSVKENYGVYAIYASHVFLS